MKKEHLAIVLGMVRGVRARIERSPGLSSEPFSDDGWATIEEALTSQLKDEPIKMLLFCPRCRTQHIDMPRGEWTNPPHATHTCENCSLLWRPSNTNTTGVSWIVCTELKHRDRVHACIPKPLRHQAHIVFRPMLTQGALGLDWFGTVILIDAEQPPDQQTITLWHETLHWLGLTDEAQVEAIALRLADACDITTILKEQRCSLKSS